MIKLTLPGGGIFGGAPKVPEPPPPPPPPTPMPDPDDAGIKAAQKKKTAEVLQRGGRLSTILSDQGGNDKLGA